jgi:hypothetical protein
VWVCPMFEPFLEWLYTQDTSVLERLPTVVELPEAPAAAALAGYRRAGEQRHDHCDHDDNECTVEALQGEYEELRRKAREAGIS